MDSIVITYKSKTYTRVLPRSWAELQEKKAAKCLEYLTVYEPLIAKLKIIRYLLALPRKVYKKINHLQMLELVEGLRWMQIDIKNAPVIKKFKHKGITYHMPSANFQNGTAWEYAAADKYYTDAIVNQSESDLLHLCATIARPEVSDVKAGIFAGDLRIPLLNIFDHSDIRQRAEIFKDLSPDIQLSCLMYFSAVKSYVFETYNEFLFNIRIDEDGNTMTQETDGPLFDWYSVYFDLADRGPFGDLSGVHSTRFHLLAMYLVNNKHTTDKQATERNLKSNTV